MQFYFLISILILCILFLSIGSIQKMANVSKEKWNQFECGFNTMTPSHIPFSFQFFLIAILFLIFDIEIALVLSFPMEMFTLKNSIIVYSFLMILAIGLIYEWKMGKIDWSK